MDSPALQKCLERFEKAKAALQRLERPKDLKETALAWSVAHSGKTWAKCGPKLQPWWTDKRRP
jgi:hypothetical protein